MTLPPCDRYLPDFVSAGPFEHVVEEVPYPILAIYLQALPGALWKNSTIPLWKNATPPLKTRHFFCINLIIFLGILLTKAMRRFPFKVCLTNVEVAVPIAEVIVTIARSDLPVCKRINAQKLLEEIQNKYPCIFVDKLANRANVRGVRWRQRNTDELVATLVAQAVDPSLTDSSGALRTLMQFVETYPRVMIRNYGTIAQQIPLLTRMPASIRKEVMPFVAFVLDATLKLLQSMREPSYRYALGDALHAFLSFFETISNSEAAAHYGEKLLSLCLRFFSTHTETAREVFNDRSDTLDSLLQKISPNNPNIKMLQDILKEMGIDVA